MFGFGKKKKEEENITSDYDLLNSNDGEGFVNEDFNDFQNEDLESANLQDEVSATEYNADIDSVEKFENQEDDIDEPEKKKGFFARLKEGLTKSRNSFAESFANLFKANEIDDDFYDELEETLVMADLGVETTEKIIDDLKVRLKNKR